MPYDEPDPDDPMLMVGVELPASATATRELVYAFAEEFASMGHGEDWILRLFGTPFYAGAHRAAAQLGEAETRAIVRECVAVWGRVRIVDREPAPAPAPFKEC